MELGHGVSHPRVSFAAADVPTDWFDPDAL